MSSPLNNRRIKRLLLLPEKNKLSYAVLAVVFFIGAFLLVGGIVRYQAYQRTLETYRQEAIDGSRSGATDEQRQQAEGKDEADRTGYDLSSYRVAPTEPRILLIEKLGIRARILPMSVNRDGSMQAPINIFDSGWYTGSSRPGQLGATIIDGHASGPSRSGLFAYLDTLSPGDGVVIERGDGEMLQYRVTTKRTIPLEQVDMSEFIRTEDGEESLHLITCTGKWLSGQHTYDRRVVVSAERVAD